MLSFTSRADIPAAAVKYLAPTRWVGSSLHKIMHLAPWCANPPGAAIMLAWKDVLPVLGLAPTSISWPSDTPSTNRVTDGILNAHFASSSALAISVSIVMSSHSMLRLGMKSSPYASSRLRNFSSVLPSPLTISKPMLATSSPITCWNSLDNTSCDTSLPIGCSIFICINKLW